MKIESEFSLEAVQDADNIADLLAKTKRGKKDLQIIGSDVVSTYDIDEQSRKGWTEKMKDATNLALQLSEEKSYPWPKAANVKLPM